MLYKSCLIYYRRSCYIEFYNTGIKLYAGESWELMVRRWSKLVKDFRVKNDNFDISKVPDIYDCIKYDVQHNMKVLNFPEAEELHALSKSIADVVVPQV